MRRTDEYEGEGLHPQWTFDPTTLETWLRCPECHSEHVTIDMAELRKTDSSVPWSSSEALWFSCDSCGEESSVSRGLPVEQPEDDEEGVITKVKELFT